MTGEFDDMMGNRWSVAIDGQESDYMMFEVDPVEVEWPQAAPEDCAEGSQATVRLESPGDRTYQPLWGEGRMCEIRRGGSLWWRGRLDGDCCQEPYEQADRYGVTLTFSDFDCLRRMRWPGSANGLVSCQEVIAQAMAMAGLQSVPILHRFSTTDGYGALIDLSRVECQEANFYDEDGEPLAMMDVMEGMIRPLGLKIRQWRGTIWIYDLNFIAGESVQTECEWSGDTQTLEATELKSRITARYSPYTGMPSDSVDMPADIATADLKGGRWWEYSDAATAKSRGYHTFFSNLADLKAQKSGATELPPPSFNIFISDSDLQGGIVTKGAGMRSFHIEPLVSGVAASDGICWGFNTNPSSAGSYANFDTAFPAAKAIRQDDVHNDLQEIMTTRRIYLPYRADHASWMVRVRMEMLYDARYNPFEQGDDNYKGDYDAVNDNVDLCALFASVRLYPDKDSVSPSLYYTNADPASYPSGGSIGRNARAGSQWVTTDYMHSLTYDMVGQMGSYGGTCLSWYDKDDPQGRSGIQGWKANRQYMGRRSETPPLLKKVGDGEYIPYPPQGGWLEVSVGGPLLMFKGTWEKQDNMPDFAIKHRVTAADGTVYDTCPTLELNRMADRMKWLLFKPVEITFARADGDWGEEEESDVEHTGDAGGMEEENLSVQGVCGTGSPSPSATGTLFYKGTPMDDVERAGVVDTPEMLLIGSLCSQYGERRERIIGEAYLTPQTTFGAMSEANTGGVFWIAGEVAHPKDGTTDMVIERINKDGYKGI